VTAETSNEIARIVALEQLINELKARVTALETRLAASEQALAQKWFQ
jgi:hypothetical protein